MAWILRQGLRGPRRPLLVAGAIALAAMGGGSALAAGSSAAQTGQVRVGGPPAVASTARALGAVSASVPMHVAIVLKPRDPAALAAFARDVSTPGSSVYHQYLTPAQFGARFGASATQARAVQSSMRAHGLGVGAASANRLTIPVAGNVGQVERAFAISFHRVAMAGGRRAVVASAGPALDRAIAGEVQAVIGLSSVSVPRPLLVRRTLAEDSMAARSTAHVPHAAAAPGPQPCAAAKTTAASQGAYTTDQIASAYRFSDLYAGGAEGQGETIAIYELESFNSSDVAQYQSCYGLPTTPPTVVSVDGGAGNGSGSGEAALDIEQAVGLAPRASIRVYEGPNSGGNAPGSGPYDTLSAIVAEDRANVVSISWGQCEQVQGSGVLTAEKTLLEEAAAQGQSVVSATGDNGSEDCDGSNSLGVDNPGSQQFVTGVGGTALVSPGPPPDETVWNDAGASGPSAGHGAGGGGLSDAWAMPGYQSNASPTLNVVGPYSSGSPCANSGGRCRQVPDVAADADPARGYLIYLGGSWQAVGGTSAAAPLWAALLADADSSSACRGSAIGFANPALYHAAATSYGSYFNDVTSGDNDFTGSNGGLYPARPGYDMASGLGSPKAGPLAAALCSGSLRVQDPGAQLSTLGQPVSLRLRTTALPDARLQFYASQLPPGLSISKSTGRITGRPKRIGTWHSGVAALDQNLSLRGAFFSWHVVGAPAVSHATLSGVGSDRPRLTFTVTAGHEAPWLKAISVHASSGLRFARGARRVTVVGVGGRRIAYSWRIVGGRLRVALAVPAWRIRVTVRYGAIRASAALAGRVQRHSTPTVTLAVTTIDSTRHWAPAWAHLKPRS